MAAHHPVIVGKIAELKLHGPSERGVEMDLPFGQANIYIRFPHGTRNGKFIEADGPVYRIHIERHVVERAELHPGPLSDLGDSAHFHGVPGISSHRTAFTDLN